MMLGQTWLGQNSSAEVVTPVVDEVYRLFNVNSVIYQRMDDEANMLMVATNIVRNGQRLITTYLPRRMPDGTENPIVAALLRGETYAGRAAAEGQWLQTYYEPLLDANGELIGALSVGHNQTELNKGLRESVWTILMGKTGYVFALEGTGDRRGVYAISKSGSQDGTSVWETKDADGGLFVQTMIADALTTKDGSVTFARYPWQDTGATVARTKLAALTYYAPWDWVIGASVYEDEFRAASLRVEEALQSMLVLTVIVGVVALVASVAASFLLARSIANPLRLTTEAADRMAKGDFEFDIQHKGKDEIRDLLRSFKAMAAAQSQKAGLAQRIAEGDLTTDVQVASERDSLGTALHDMAQSLADVLGQVQEAVGQVSSGSDQVAQSSQSLSQGATEQASSLEEVSSALTEINGQAQRNAESATEANALAKTAVENADRGNSQMQELVAAMGRMSTSAEEITKIVKLIDDIAFQINLLALNANVEAARAGKYGKGFAVVADEVRNLAVRSAQAVKDTTRMVSETTKAIGDGGKSAEATAAAAEELSSQAAHLKALIGRFRLKEGATEAGLRRV